MKKGFCQKNFIILSTTVHARYDNSYEKAFFEGFCEKKKFICQKINWTMNEKVVRRNSTSFLCAILKASTLEVISFQANLTQKSIVFSFGQITHLKYSTSKILHTSPKTTWNSASFDVKFIKKSRKIRE